MGKAAVDLITVWLKDQMANPFLKETSGLVLWLRGLLE
jgi:hypothetical protein